MIAPLREKLSKWFLLDSNDHAIGYDSVKNVDGRRRPLRRQVYPQDRKLKDDVRERAIATTQDLPQNVAIAAWAIRKHLDYVSDLEFRGAMNNEPLDELLVSFISQWSHRLNFDVRRQHGLRRFIRMAEARRVVDGDFFAMKIGRGPDAGRIQAIEGYRVKQPSEQHIAGFRASENTQWINGVEVSNLRGIAIRYCVGHRNMTGNWVFDSFVPAPNMCSLGYYERFDQVRGISPLLAGLNEFQDTYEAVDFMKAKLKLQQLFGVAVYRDADIWQGQHGKPNASADNDEDGTAESDWKSQFGPDVFVIDGNTNDRVDMLESHNPASEQVDFLRFVLSLALKSLDLPDSFLREGETNFFGSRASLIHYLRSARSKVADLIEWLNEITRWRIGMAVASGELVLPAGVAFSDLAWEWVPTGVPWAWDPVKEATGGRLAVEAGMDSIERICLLNGTHPKRNIDERARWNAYSLRVSGQPLVFSTESTQTPGDDEIENPPNAQEDEDME